MYVKIYNLSFINGLIGNNINGNNINGNNILIKKKWCINNVNYNILKYNRSLLNKDNYHDIGLIRSLVFKDDKLVCFSPVKSLDYYNFIEKYTCETCLAEEFIEGTMINLFYDNELNKWQITTKSSVGANIKFFKNQKNFSDLFYEICNELNIDLNRFSKNYCYSFVMQHPNNKFILNIDIKKLYLIAIFEIDSINSIVKEIPKIYYSNLNLPENLSYPYAHYIDSFDNLVNHYGSMNTPINIMGIIVKNMNGDKTKIRNPNYNYIKQLKGNNMKLQYHYLELYKNNKIEEYLKFFPENIKEFNIYKKILYNFTETLYSNYINCYIKKEKYLNDYPFQYKNHMYFIHQEYLKNKNSNNNFFITKKFVINYIKNLESPRLMFSLNYHLRILDKTIQPTKNENKNNIINNDMDINLNI